MYVWDERQAAYQAAEREYRDRRASIVKLHQAGYSNAKIAKELDIDESTVRTTLNQAPPP